jgi:hypothetical protein
MGILTARTAHALLVALLLRSTFARAQQLAAVALSPAAVCASTALGFCDCWGQSSLVSAPPNTSALTSVRNAAGHARGPLERGVCR